MCDNYLQLESLRKWLNLNGRSESGNVVARFILAFFSKPKVKNYREKSKIQNLYGDVVTRPPRFAGINPKEPSASNDKRFLVIKVPCFSQS